MSISQRGQTTLSALSPASFTRAPMNTAVESMQPAVAPTVTLFTAFVAMALTLATSSQGLLTALSKVDGGYQYNFATVPFVSECIKFVISSYLLSSEYRRNPGRVLVTKDLKTSALYIVPSIIYFVHNNVQFFTLKFVDPATYQILGNLKIVTTGILFRFFLGRQLTPLQWTALLLLTTGATTSQISSRCVTEGSSQLAAFSAPPMGYMFGIISAFLSGFAGVYTEYVMKKNNDCLYWQNMQLYFYGIIFNAAGLTFNSVQDNLQGGFWPLHMFKGYNYATVLVALNLALSGLLVSWIMKYADSIMKVFATSMAMLVTMAFSVMFFGTTLSLQLMLGIVTACCSLQLYYMKITDVLMPQAPAKQPLLQDPEARGFKTGE